MKINPFFSKPSFLIVLLLTCCSSLLAQSEEEKKFILPKALFKASPLHFFNSTLMFGTELFNQSYSRSFNLDLGIRSSSRSYEDGRGFSVEVGYRKYVKPMTLRTRKSRQVYQGIYYNLFLQGSTFKGDYKDYVYSPSSGISTYQNSTRTANSISPGFYMGLQKTLWEVLTMDVYFGGGIRFSDVTYSAGSTDYYSDDDILTPGHEGIYPKIGIKIGIGL